MRILLRADASALIGAGHQMRCLALAQAWKRLGCTAFFASASSLDGIVARLNGEQFVVELVEASCGSDEDAMLTRQLAETHGCNWIVLDGYHFGERYQQVLSQFSGSVLAIDDFGQCANWHVQAVVNYNLFASAIPYSGVSEKCVLRGPKFTPLREELIQRGETGKTARPENRILVTLGGSNVTATISTLLGMLNQYDDRMLEIRIVIGNACDARAISVAFKKGRHTCEISLNPTNMAIHYRWANRVICAAGSTCFECLYFDLPMAVIGIADNQTMNLNSLRERRLATFLGWGDSIDKFALFHFLNSTISNKLPNGLIDGHGADRIAQFMRFGIE